MIKLNFNKDLTNLEIQNICNQLNIKLNGIFMKDELKTNLKNGNYIINLQNHNQSGSHWLGFYKSKNNIYWFDSFGVQMPQNEFNIFKQEHDNIYYSNVQIQDMKSILCGYFVIAYLYFVNKMKGKIENRIYQYQKLFNWDNQKGNDKILESLFKQF